MAISDLYVYFRQVKMMMKHIAPWNDLALAVTAKISVLSKTANSAKTQKK